MMPSGVRSAGPREFLVGLLLALGVVAALSLLPLLPWGVIEPAVAFVGGRPLLDSLFKAGFVLLFIGVGVMLVIWWERKFAGWMQARLGPMHVGWKGLIQSVADAVKLLTKEDIIPAKSDRALFIVAPFLVFLPTVLTFMVLPWGARWVGFDYDLAVAFAFGVSTMAAVAILAAGWGGNNKYSLLGGARAVAQLISYEIPVVLSVLSMALVTGTLSMTEMVNGQESAWNIVRHAPIAVPALLMFLIGTLAELNRTPFDLPEAESELVSGFHTEYSGMRFALFYLAEFANNFFSAGFAVVMFFGGWRGPVLPEPVWFTIKTVLVITLLMWIRWTMPRLRVDQMMGFCWKLLVPAGLVLLCGASMWALWQR